MIDEIDSKTKPFLLALQIFSILSTTTSFSVLVAIASSSALRSKMFSVLAGYIAFSDFISSLFCALHFLAIKSDFLCQSKSFMASWFNLSAVLWMSCLTHMLCSIVVRNQGRKVNISKFHHLLCWIFPLVLSILPRLTLDIKWGVWPIESDETGELLEARRVFALGCFFAPTETTPNWLRELGAMLPFMFYVAWVYLGVIFMTVEVIWVLVVASRLYPGVEKCGSFYSDFF